jgi:L-threonylcarbamoyladenylate synthase
VVFPTETVYGLGASAVSPEALLRIFAAKGRPTYNPLIVHVSDAAAAQEVVAAWPELAQRAAAAFWPGPLTLVLPRRSHIPDVVTAGLPTVGVRVPAHPVAQALLRAVGVPVAAPSANLFTRVSPTTAEHVIAGLGDRVDLILDGGSTPYGIESTVLDVSGDGTRLLRHGAIGLDEVRAALGAVDDVTTASSVAGAGLPSPGMADRHYSPNGRIIVFSDPEHAAELTVRQRDAGETVGAVIRSAGGIPAQQRIALPEDARGYARLFYAALHSLDAAGCDLILVEAAPDTAEWAAIRDRLRRAAQ